MIQNYANQVLRPIRRLLDSIRSKNTSVASPKSSNSRANTLPEGVADLKRLVWARKSANSFEPNHEIDMLTMQEILRLTLRAPSSFNLLPFKCILVKDKGVKKNLAYCMTAGNIRKVLQSSVTAVFAADKQPAKRIRRMIEIERNRGVLSEAQLERLRFNCEAIVGTEENESYLRNDFYLRKSLFCALSTLTAMPTINSSMEAWSFKNTMPAVQLYLMACSAYGLSTCPMEGFDTRRVKETLSIPERYSIPVVVATGMSSSSRGDTSEETTPSARMPYEETFCLDDFEFPLYETSTETSSKSGNG